MLLGFATLIVRYVPISDVSIDSRPNEFLSDLMFGGFAAGVCHSVHGVEIPQSSWDIRSYRTF